jgi:hypothetical protein
MEVAMIPFKTKKAIIALLFVKGFGTALARGKEER